MLQFVTLPLAVDLVHVILLITVVVLLYRVNQCACEKYNNKDSILAKFSRGVGWNV